MDDLEHFRDFLNRMIANIDARGKRALPAPRRITTSADAAAQSTNASVNSRRSATSSTFNGGRSQVSEITLSCFSISIGIQIPPSTRAGKSKKIDFSLKPCFSDLQANAAKSLTKSGAAPKLSGYRVLQEGLV